jgi:hypothetical protein
VAAGDGVELLGCRDRPRLGHRLQIGAGAEGLIARSGEHQSSSVIVSLEAAIGVEQQARRLGVDCVSPLRPGDRDHRRWAAALVAHLRHRGAHPMRGHADA